MAQVNMEKARGLRDYRSAYFREYPGILGRIWICSQCAKPLWGKHNVQVDHIVALSKAAKFGKLTKSDNPSVLAYAAHQNFNLGAICAKCNKKKSDKVGFVTVRGYAAKVVEVLMFKTQDAIILGLWGVKGVGSLASRAVLPKSKRPKTRKVSKPKLGDGPLSALVAGTVFTAGSLAYYGGKGGLKAGKLAGKGLMAPLKSDINMVAKLGVVTVYAVILYIIWLKLFG